MLHRWFRTPNRPRHWYFIFSDDFPEQRKARSADYSVFLPTESVILFFIFFKTMSPLATANLRDISSDIMSSCVKTSFTDDNGITTYNSW